MLAVPTPPPTPRMKIPFPKVPGVPTPKKPWLLPPPFLPKEEKKRPPSLFPRIPRAIRKTYAPTLWGYYGLPKIPAKKELAKMIFTGILPRPGVKFPTRKKKKAKRRKRR